MKFIESFLQIKKADSLEIVLRRHVPFEILNQKPFLVIDDCYLILEFPFSLKKIHPFGGKWLSKGVDQLEEMGLRIVLEVPHAVVAEENVVLVHLAVVL